VVWGVTLGLLVAYVQRFWGFKPATLAGIALCIGVPYLHHYDAKPIASGYSLGMLLSIVFLWLTLKTLEKGWTRYLCAAWGFLTGLGFYTSRQLVFSVMAVVFVLLALPAGRKRLREFVQVPSMGIFLACALAGFFPELVYKPDPYAESAPPFGLASPDMMLDNLYFLMRAIPAYFDGDPLARIPEVYNPGRNENIESFPLRAADMVGTLAAFVTVHFVIENFRQSWRDKNVPVMLLAAFSLKTRKKSSTSGHRFFSSARAG